MSMALKNFMLCSVNNGRGHFESLSAEC